MPPKNIVIYGAFWCPDCRRATRFFQAHDIPYDWVNIDKDKDAEAFVKKVNAGNRSIPTIVFQDGSILVEPSTEELELMLDVPS